MSRVLLPSDPSSSPRLQAVLSSSIDATPPSSLIVFYLFLSSPQAFSSFLRTLQLSRPQHFISSSLEVSNPFSLSLKLSGLSSGAHSLRPGAAEALVSWFHTACLPRSAWAASTTTRTRTQTSRPLTLHMTAATPTARGGSPKSTCMQTPRIPRDGPQGRCWFVPFSSEPPLFKLFSSPAYLPVRPPPAHPPTLHLRRQRPTSSPTHTC
jgi:hypothetical protein